MDKNDKNREKKQEEKCEDLNDFFKEVGEGMKEAFTKPESWFKIGKAILKGLTDAN